ncbi:MAG TPA: methyltransferase domain-containing protein [Thermodesulfovibrionia bacterium]|nr:methyltransferase domain-containing protein [Thermodesulfovibrionia bacterium]
MWDFIFQKEIEVIEPSEEMLRRALSEEWCGSYIYDILYPEQHWSKCIVEQIVSVVDNEIIANSVNYKELVYKEFELLALQDCLTIADIGCSNQKLPKLINNETKNTVLYRIDSTAWSKINEINKQQAESLLNLKKYYSEHLFYILRGKVITKKNMEFLSDTFPECEKNIILDINKGAQFIQNLFKEKAIVSNELNTSVLSFNNIDCHLNMPLESDWFDRVNSSLILSYVRNPYTILKESYRILKKGGIIVASFFKPEVNISKRDVDFITDVLQKDSQFFLMFFRTSS